eukprot:NODE_2941_length_966_cov_63.764005_g2921_i0.p2 GENE.NODE_2941_length_966_cov_63.764005_g2921_i0~~NODE_2941_length_966_cov_63.764005_g2921_i0.p2  ORF type:complete len:121 (-),score=6.96 NODE_2941_length_966_cov_63.764005_g2921_i0:71-433(-)
MSIHTLRACCKQSPTSTGCRKWWRAPACVLNTSPTSTPTYTGYLQSGGFNACVIFSNASIAGVGGSGSCTYMPAPIHWYINESGGTVACTVSRILLTNIAMSSGCSSTTASINPVKLRDC